MKRLFVLFAFLLVSCAVFAQDEKPQSEGTLLVVPRLDFDPAYNGGGEWSFDLGSTSLYTLFEGNITPNLSFSVCNHWLAFSTGFDDTADLYRNTGRAYSTNWVDWANLTYKMGNFFVSAGKDYIHVANFEIEDYDYDAHWQMNSFLWNNFQVYQWGGRVGWQNDDETLTVSLQMTTDPLMYRFYELTDIGNYAYTFNAFYEGETVSLMGSVTHSGSWGWIGALGAKLAVSDALSLQTDINMTNFLRSGSIRLDATVSDQVELFGKLGYEWLRTDWDETAAGGHYFGGFGCNWYPLRDSHDLRIHALAAPSVYSDLTGDIVRRWIDGYFSLGATYFFEFSIF
ncbi:MAG: hypothetical protein IKX34_05650 [Bacteroidales bacterium]|nr:hypothetical protein [Bacteroidales bacterium]